MEWKEKCRMEFMNNIFALDKPSSVKFELAGTKLPGGNDIFFSLKAT